MSGTSCDGLDICYCTFRFSEAKWHFEILEAETIPYTAFWQESLSKANTLSGRDLTLLHKNFGNFSGEMVNSFISKYNLPKPDYIASHGHTVFHEPHLGLNLQIGDGNCIVAKTRIRTIADFRSLDIALGGQGAPLVPIGDKLLFGEYNACLNLGGIANISFEHNGQHIAGDISPFNILFNHYANQLGSPFDDGGKFAESGIVNEELLDKLNQLPFISEPFPKSMGIEKINQAYFPILNQYGVTNEDFLVTLSRHFVQTLINTITQHNIKSLLVTGGGAYNDFYIESIKAETSIRVTIPDSKTINFKEALIFGFLGCLKMANQINVLKSVTGAKTDSVSGVEYVV